jgi:hypothetical protein
MLSRKKNKDHFSSKHLGKAPFFSKKKENAAFFPHRGRSFFNTSSELIQKKQKQADREKDWTLTNSDIQIFDDPASRKMADQMGAHGLAWRNNIYLGSLVDRPYMPSREEVIRHEMVHIKQMQNSGPAATSQALEREARGPNAQNPQLSADPNQPLGFWWVIPVAVGVYILLRPSVANAPAPGDEVFESPSLPQIVGEALVLFALPGGIVRGLGQLGYGVVASYAVSGGVTSVAYRGVQDVGEGSFSGIDAYILDATTGAVLGVVMGGTVRLFGGARVAAPAAREAEPLVHLTDEAGYVGITESGVLRGSQGIYAVPGRVQTEGMARRFLRTLVAPSRTQHAVPIPEESLGLFQRPSAVGPVSLYQRWMGVYRAPAGSLSLSSGALTPAGRMANVTGQFWPYGVDSLIWIGGGTAAGVSFYGSAQETGAAERGLYQPFYDVITQQPPLPGTVRNDGPFIFLQPNEGEVGPSTEEGFTVLPELNMPTGPDVPSEQLFDPSVLQGLSEEQLLGGAGTGGRMPAVIFVTPTEVVGDEE